MKKGSIGPLLVVGPSSKALLSEIVVRNLAAEKGSVLVIGRRVDQNVAEDARLISAEDEGQPAKASVPEQQLNAAIRK